MSTTQTLLWVALPKGVQTDGDARHLRLSVFVTPRLRTDEGTTLALFPDFLDWAARMQPDQVTFRLEVDDGTQVQATVVSDQPDTALWPALFTSAIPVRLYEFDDFSNRPIVSFPVSRVLGYLKETYQTIASRAPFDLPPITRDDHNDERQGILAEVFQDLVLLQGEVLRVENEEQLTQRLNDSLERGRHIARQRRAARQPGDLIEPSGVGAPDDPRDAFYRSMLFHYRPRRAEPVELPEGAAARAHFEEEVDFHQMLSALGDFPQLLRRLGLIFDLQVPADALPQTPNELAFRKVRVVPTWTSTFPPRQTADQILWTANYNPWTVYGYAALNGQDLFIPISRQGEISAGLWTPHNDIELVQVDVDGAALKTLNLASSLARVTMNGEPRAIDAPDKDGVPTLRTGGVSVVRIGAAKSMNDTFNRSGALNQMLATDPPQLADLHAEDLTRGYRLDVLESRTGQWRSLHQRIGTYTTLNAPGTVPDIADEGFTQPSVTSPVQTPVAPPDPAQELYVHESLFTWDGWSLSAPRPGKSISRSARAPTDDDPDTQPQRVNNTAMTRLSLETSFKVQDGTLPRLRFGQSYRLRIRTVDLAGNSLTPDEATALEATLPQMDARLPKNDDLFFRRFEPINPPELVPRQLYHPDGNVDDPTATGFAEGESLERLVIRSNFDQSAGDYAAAHPAYQPVNERHIAAPKASLQLVETHGLLDEALDAKNSGLPPDQVRAQVQAVYALARREAGSLNDTTLPSVRFIRTGTDADSTEGYAVHTEEQLVLPYLPDPWAIGVVFQGLPGLAPDALMPIKFGGAAWHEALPFRLRLVEGGGAPAWDEATRVLTVQLPKSGVARVRTSSLFGADLELMGLWQWLREAAEDGAINGDQMAELERGIMESRHWMFTPFRDLTLVHAVQQPLEELQPQQLEVDRFVGSTAAHLRGAVTLHAPSISKLDILAEWTEPRDDPTKDEPDTVDARAHVMEIPTTLDGQAIRVEYPEADDALRLEDDNLLVFNSKQADFARSEMQEELDDPGANLTPKQRRHLQDQINLASKVTAHEFGDTKYRRVRYHVSATTRFREYFAPGITGQPQNLAQLSHEIEMDILSSARPAAPRVLYVLPTFGWEQTTDAHGNVTSVRRGGGVRVYLDRPWWSSGDGELLGVVLGQSLPSRRESLYSYSTFWGQDPVWQSPGLPLPRPPSFKNNREVFQTVKLAELDNQFVTVVGFKVDWDGIRKLWYCDLDLDTTDAYHPFIRLALARFQNNSLVLRSDSDPRPWLDLRLSPVVLADFVQTAPNRAVTITRDAGAPGIYGVSVSGVTYSAQRSLDNTVAAATSQVEVLVQRRVPNIEDETLGWTDLPLTVGLSVGAPDAQGVVVWTGQVTIPPEHQGEQLRLVVQEFEMLPVATAAGIAAPAGRHVVYVDTISL